MIYLMLHAIKETTNHIQPLSSENPLWESSERICHIKLEQEFDGRKISLH